MVLRGCALGRANIVSKMGEHALFRRLKMTWRWAKIVSKTGQQ